MPVNMPAVTKPPGEINGFRRWAEILFRAIRTDLRTIDKTIIISGDGTAEGDWQFFDDGTDLHTQRLEDVAGTLTWVTKSRALASNPS